MERSHHIEFSKINLILVGAALSGLEFFNKDSEVLDSKPAVFLFISGVVFAVASIVYGYNLLENGIDSNNRGSNSQADEVLMILTNLSAIIAFILAFGIGLSQPRNENAIYVLLAGPFLLIPAHGIQLLRSDRDAFNEMLTHYLWGIGLVFMMVLFMFIMFKVKLPPI